MQKSSPKNNNQPLNLESNNQEIQQILDYRADLFSRVLKDTKATEEHAQFVHIRLGNAEEYGVPYQFTEEIISQPFITRVPCTPAYIHGVTNRRGQMLTILDLKYFFKLNHDQPPSSKATILVVNHNEITAGLIIDEVLGNQEYLPSNLTQPLPSIGVSDLKYVSGIYQGNITMLAIDVLLTDPNILVNDRVNDVMPYTERQS